MRSRLSILALGCIAALLGLAHFRGHVAIRKPVADAPMRAGRAEDPKSENSEILPPASRARTSRSRVETGGSDPSVVEAGSPSSSGELEALVAQLRRIDAKAGESGFHEPATAVAERLGMAMARAEGVGRWLDERLSDPAETPRVVGALLFAAGHGEVARLRSKLLSFVRRRGAPPVRRGAIQGLARPAGKSPAYAVEDYFASTFAPFHRGETAYFRIGVRLAPLDAEAEAALLAVAAAEGDPVTRALAVLVAGQAVDDGGDVRPLCLDRLRPEDWWKDPIAFPCIYVLVRSADPGVRRELMAVMRSMEAVGGQDHEFTFNILMDLVRTEPTPEVVDAVLDALRDTERYSLFRSSLTFTLAQSLQDAGEAYEPQRARAVEAFESLVFEGEGYFARFAALGSLTILLGAESLPHLETVLLTDADAEMRARTADILPETAGSDEVAFDVLAAAWNVEEDPKVKERILVAIAKLEADLVRPFLLQVAAADVGGPFGALAEEALTGDGGD